jgi:glycosyltransferase involved in cell wall biosynthesis
MQKISVVVPCYNVEKYIDSTKELIENIIEEIKTAVLGVI